MIDLATATNKDIAEELFRRNVNYFILIDNNDGSHMQSSRGDGERIGKMLDMAIGDIFYGGQAVNAGGILAQLKFEARK